MQSKKVVNKERLPFSLLIDFNDQAALAYHIILYDNQKCTACYFILNEDNAYLIKNNLLEKQWNITKIFYDATGGEIITSKGDIIYLSKEISIKETSGEEITLEYKPIDIDKIVFKAKNS
jgi:hypothetical protein